MRLNAPLRREIEGGPAPAPGDELMLYQTLVGAWPPGLSPEDAQGVAAFGERVGAWQEKALREAKLRTGWAAPDAEYEQVCRDFLGGVLDPARPTRVVFEVAEFAARIAPAGIVNALAQTLIRLTAPGVPDLYQGTEFWDFSLVDPDNRRPVDFAAREAALAAGGEPPALLADWQDGRVKQAMIARALAFRARHRGLFAHGTYLPLRFEGRLAEHAIGFARTHEGRAFVMIATRLAARLPGIERLSVESGAWEATAAVLPRLLSGRSAHDVLRDPTERMQPMGAGGRLPLRDVLTKFPVALLEVR
jgi:(1->4)-alpha-D-glucan 1-alpha-D-glucosylmutase